MCFVMSVHHLKVANIKCTGLFSLAKELEDALNLNTKKQRLTKESPHQETFVVFAGR